MKTSTKITGRTVGLWNKNVKATRQKKRTEEICRKGGRFFIQKAIEYKRPPKGERLREEMRIYRFALKESIQKGV